MIKTFAAATFTSLISSAFAAPRIQVPQQYHNVTTYEDIAKTHANGLGTAVILNNCEFPVYMWNVDGGEHSNAGDQPPITIGPKNLFQEVYRLPMKWDQGQNKIVSAGGVSMKIAKVFRPQLTNDVPILQYEYTVDGGKVWFDGSYVDCQNGNCPFEQDGVYLGGSRTDCTRTQICLPGQVPCPTFYKNWDDDQKAMIDCDQRAMATLTLCYKGL